MSRGTGLALRALREAAGLSLVEAAKVTEMSAPYLDAVERAQVEPSSGWFVMVADALAEEIVACPR